jgi:hypothetical protein
LKTATLEITPTTNESRFMSDPKSPIYSRNQDRRSVLNRRWIKSDYSGEERRSGEDRRQDLPDQDLPVPEEYEYKEKTGLEKLLVSNAIQLEALTRILINKGHVTEEELLEMMNMIQAEYQSKK